MSVLGTSAKTGHNIERALGLIVLNAIKHYYPILSAVKKSSGDLEDILRLTKQPEEEITSQLQFASWRRLILADWDKKRYYLTKGVSNILDILEFGNKQI
jgi:hypothetical protein